jgi:hypothetical protein
MVIVPKVLTENAANLNGPLKLPVSKINGDTGKVPVDWKRANITDIFKKGCRRTGNMNYRSCQFDITLLVRFWNQLSRYNLWTT